MKVLVTGGTGFLGSHLVRTLLRQHHAQVVSFARGEHGHEKQQRAEDGDHRLDSVIGDVRDPDSVLRAIRGCGLVYHAAAQKCVPWAEKHPEECIKTNVQGSINVQKAAEEVGAKAVLISTDKACKPINTYGASKYLAERIWKGPIVRMGNIWGSTGSVVYWLLNQRGSGQMKITSRKMKRFHITVDEAVEFILAAAHQEKGVHIPIMRWYALEDLATAIDPDAKIVETGIRQGEKYAEDLSEDFVPCKSALSIEELRREVELLCGSGATADTPK